MSLRTALGSVSVACLLGALGSDLPAIGADQPATRRADPFPLDLAFTRRDFPFYEKAEVSPDGSRVAYSVVTPMKRREDVWTLASGLPAVYQGGRIHIVEVATQKVLPVGADLATSFAPAWSPDGSKLAYYSDEEGALRAWVFDTKKGTSTIAADLRVKFHYHLTTVMPPTWSPDGRKLLVPALPAAEVGLDPRPNGGDIATGPGGTRPSILVLASGDEPAPPAKEHPRSYGIYDSLVDLTEIDLAAKRLRVLLPAKPPEWKGTGPAFARYSPSGRFLAYVSGMRTRPTEGNPTRDVLDVGVVRVGETRPLHVEEISEVYLGRESHFGDYLGRAGVILAWHPTDDTLLFLDDKRLRMLDLAKGTEPRAVTLAAESGQLNGDCLAFVPGRREVLVGLISDGSRPEALALIPLDGEPPRTYPLLEGSHPGQVVRRDGASLWQPVAGSATFLVRDERGGRTLARRLVLETGAWTSLPIASETVEIQGMPHDGSFLVALVQGMNRPPDLHRFGVDFSDQGRLTTIEPRLEGRDIGTAESFETVVPLHDGRLKPVRTAVLLPPGAKRGERLPAIVEVYGGDDRSLSMRHFGGGEVGEMPAPIFTSRGYAVLQVDAPIGPPGVPGRPLDELRDVVLPQVYRAAELGYVDIDRVSLAGQSYGGYCTAGLVSTTNLFRAAVAVDGSYDLGSKFGFLRPGEPNGDAEWLERGQGRMGKPLWGDAHRYIDNSPYYRADRIRTPLLLIHGREDRACPAGQAEMMFVALRRLGRTAQLAIYEGEGHVVSRWETSHAVDAADRTLSFLRRHLEPKPKDD